MMIQWGNGSSTMMCCFFMFLCFSAETVQFGFEFTDTMFCLLCAVFCLLCTLVLFDDVPPAIGEGVVGGGEQFVIDNFTFVGGMRSTDVTCGGLCLRTAKNACKSVPAHSGGVYGFSTKSKNHTPHANGERAGTWFPHTPTGNTH
jgi:hypothetical protein